MKSHEQEAAEASQRLKTALRLAKEAIRLAQDGIATLERLKQAPLIYSFNPNEGVVQAKESFDKDIEVAGEFGAAFQKFLDAAGLLEDLSCGDTPGKRGVTLRGFHLTRDYGIDPLKV